MKNLKQGMYIRGNILFLILLAVVLFAALSYAVTSSMRGGGKDISSEKADSLAAIINQEMVRMKSVIQRLKLVEDYRQVKFDTSAPTSNGTCYEGATAITPCKTIGLFNAATGASLPFWEERMRDPAYFPPSANFMNDVWVMNYARLIVNGVDVGTSAPDVSVWAGVLPKSICEALNRAAGISTIGTMSMSTTDPAGRTWQTYRAYINAFASYLNYTTSINISHLGCNAMSNAYYYVYVTEEY